MSIIQKASFEDAQAVLVRSAKMHDMELSQIIFLQLQEQELALIIFLLTNVQRKGIVVFNTPGANANAVKEQVIAAIAFSIKRFNRW